MINRSYSATVIMTLFACGAEMSVSHLGDNFLIVRDSVIDSTKLDAELVVSVDGNEQRRKIQIESIKTGQFVQATYIDPLNFTRQLEEELSPEDI